MSDIPPLAIERLTRLRRMYDMSRAQVDGMQEALNEARRGVERAVLALELVTRGHHRPVTVGPEDGVAYEYAGREHSSTNLRGAAFARWEITGEHVRAPAFDAAARAVHLAKKHLSGHRQLVGRRPRKVGCCRP